MEEGETRGGEGGAPEGGLATLPTTPPPLVGGSAREVSDLAVSLNVVGVGVGAQWWPCAVVDTSRFVKIILP